jgi:hypothetical protein
MLHYLLLAYVAFYAFIGISLFALHALIVPEEDKEKDKPWETPLDVLLCLAGLAGMLFLLLQFEPPWLKLAWRPVSVALLLAQAYANLKTGTHWFRSAEEVVDREVRVAADAATLLFLAPSLALNLFYAFR